MSSTTWRPGWVDVGPAAIMGWVREADELGAVFCCDGGNFGRPGATGWVHLVAGVPVGSFFPAQDSIDPKAPPPLLTGLPPVPS